MTASFAQQVHWPSGVQDSLKTVGTSDPLASSVVSSQHPQHPQTEGQATEVQLAPKSKVDKSHKSSEKEGEGHHPPPPEEEELELLPPMGTSSSDLAPQVSATGRKSAAARMWRAYTGRA
jgi:hypothetical protein